MRDWLVWAATGPMAGLFWWCVMMNVIVILALAWLVWLVKTGRYVP